ncbi:MAG: hypothetical protein M1330_03600, partial [Armatimonadetes bacterium]|nr:hypothetical protein [Armatimonadota bacterium]
MGYRVTIYLLLSAVIMSRPAFSLPVSDQGAANDLPYVQAQFSNRSRTEITVTATAYRLVVDTAHPRVIGFCNRLGGRPHDNVLSGFEILLSVWSNRIEYNNRRAPIPAQAEIRENGPIYCEVVINHVILGGDDTSPSDQPLPLPTKITLACTPYHVFAWATLNPSVDLPVESGAIRVGFGGGHADLFSRVPTLLPLPPSLNRIALTLTDGSEATTILTRAPAEGKPLDNLIKTGQIAGFSPPPWKVGSRQRAWVELIPSGQDISPIVTMDPDLYPLAATSFNLAGGAQPVFDPLRRIWIVSGITKANSVILFNDGGNG